MVTKRQLGIILELTGLGIAIGVIAVDIVGAGEWSGFGPLQWLGIAASVLVQATAVILILIGNRPA